LARPLGAARILPRVTCPTARFTYTPSGPSGAFPRRPARQEVDQAGGDAAMLWLVVGSIVMAGLQFNEALASFEIYNPQEITFLVSGALVGLAMGFLIQKIEAF
jgi:hypothetical protein